MSAHSVLGPIQAAIYGALTANAPFMALVRGVYDDVPESAAFPYVSIGDATEIAWDCFGQDGSDATITMHVWSTYRGMSEAQRINTLMIGVLDNQTGLTVTGYGLVVLNKEFTETLRDPDGITRHIVTRFRVMADAT
jgi:hypothetical protein